MKDPNFALGYDFKDGLGTGQFIGNCVRLPGRTVTKWFYTELVVYGGDDYEHVVLHAWNLNSRMHYYAQEDGSWVCDATDERIPSWMPETWNCLSSTGGEPRP